MNVNRMRRYNLGKQPPVVRFFYCGWCGRQLREDDGIHRHTFTVPLRG